MTDNSQPESRPSFGERLLIALGVFLRALAKLILVLVLIAAVGFALFYGFPWLYTRYVVPVQENTQRLDALEANQEALGVQLTRSARDLEDSLSTLEAAGSANSGTNEGLKERLDAFEATLPARLEADESSLKETLARLETLEESLSGLEAQAMVISTTMASDSSTLRVISETLQTGEQIADGTWRDLQLVKAMELVTRSRLFITQNNLGLAEQDITDARQLLFALRPAVPAYQLEALDAILVRLEFTLKDFKQAPVLVPDDLEIVWQLLVRGLPKSPALSAEDLGLGTPLPPVTTTVTATLTLEVTLTETPSPERTRTTTPTPGRTSTPTPTGGAASP